MLPGAVRYLGSGRGGIFAKDPVGEYFVLSGDVCDNAKEEKSLE